ncbi:MAG: cyclase family protein [Bacteroidota bacterium]
MSTFIDLSHTLEDGMPGFKMKNEDGSATQFTVSIKPFLTHAQSALKYEGKAAFEITEMKFHTSIGTYIDSPYHRYPGMKDISQMKLDDLILPGIVIDVRGMKPYDSVKTNAMPPKENLRGKAVLFNFGWDKYWNPEGGFAKPEYHAYPFISREVIRYLLDAKVKLAGVDTINIDDHHDPERPAHSWLLKEEIYVVENLCNLDKLLGLEFRFFAVPVKGKKVSAMPVRAFGEVL